MEEEELVEETAGEETDQMGGFVGLFRHPHDPVDEGDFDEEREQRLVVSLTQHDNNPVTWQAQCIALWRQIVEAAAETNADHPAQQRMVRDQYPILFQYLAEGAPANSKTVLTAWEIETGKPDLKDTIGGREVILMTRLENNCGRMDLDLALEAYILAGEQEEEPAYEAKPVPREGVPVLYFKKGLLDMVMERADYGESDLLDKHHTLFLKDLTDQEVYTNVVLL
ncbi:MAG: hypothetical protein GY835_24105, partial [bacterium]|nr:hypothetical protein [bacterium]